MADLGPTPLPTPMPTFGPRKDDRWRPFRTSPRTPIVRSSPIVRSVAGIGVDAAEARLQFDGTGGGVEAAALERPLIHGLELGRQRPRIVGGGLRVPGGLGVQGRRDGFDAGADGGGVEQLVAVLLGEPGRVTGLAGGAAVARVGLAEPLAAEGQGAGPGFLGFNGLLLYLVPDNRIKAELTGEVKNKNGF